MPPRPSSPAHPSGSTARSTSRSCGGSSAPPSATACSAACACACPGWARSTPATNTSARPTARSAPSPSPTASPTSRSTASRSAGSAPSICTRCSICSSTSATAGSSARGSSSGTPSSREGVNLIEVRPAVARFLGPDKLLVGMNYVYMQIPTVPGGALTDRVRARAIRAFYADYAVYRQLLLPDPSTWELRRRPTRGLHFYGGYAMDDEAYGVRVAYRRDAYGGISLRGLGAFDFTFQGTVLASDTTEDRRGPGGGHRARARRGPGHPPRPAHLRPALPDPRRGGDPRRAQDAAGRPQPGRFRCAPTSPTRGPTPSTTSAGGPSCGASSSAPVCAAPTSCSRQATRRSGSTGSPGSSTWVGSSCAWAGVGCDARPADRPVALAATPACAGRAASARPPGLPRPPTRWRWGPAATRPRC